jgi:uncharacterized protein (UPF0262 family)
VANERARLIDIVLDEDTLARRGPEVEHERAVAIHDLLADNSFQLVGHDGGPYRLRIAMRENRLLFHVFTDAREEGEGDGPELARVVLPLSPFRSVIRDYFTVCEAYYEAIKTASPARIEAIDMGRRSLHNEGALILHQRLDGKIRTDGNTERRLFTLICVLHVREWSQ